MHPPPTDEQILRLLAKHRLPGGVVGSSPYEGAANYVRLVGELCVRVSKRDENDRETLAEAAIVPVLTNARVRTPALLVLDASRTIVPGIATIYERAGGQPLGLSTPFNGIAQLVQALGEQIDRWRREVKKVNDPNGWLSPPRADDLWAGYQRAAERLSPHERTWTEATIRRLETAPESEAEFVHRDLHAFNLLVGEGTLNAILDWGTGGFGDPALNYRCLPAHWLPVLLGSQPEDEAFVGRCLYHLLGYALNDAHRPPRYPGPYDHTGNRRWESFLALARRPPRPHWREWFADDPPEPIAD